MRVVQQILSPAVQHAEETDLRAQMLWIGGDDAQCLRRCPEQDVVDDFWNAMTSISWGTVNTTWK